MEEDVRAALLNRYYKDSESLQLQEFVSEALDNFLQIIYPVHATMLAYQSPSLGLFPRGKSQHARVRDNIYCAAALWCFSLAYRYQLDQIGLVDMNGFNSPNMQIAWIPYSSLPVHAVGGN